MSACFGKTDPSLKFFFQINSFPHKCVVTMAVHHFEIHRQRNNLNTNQKTLIKKKKS